MARLERAATSAEVVFSGGQVTRRVPRVVKDFLRTGTRTRGFPTVHRWLLGALSNEPYYITDNTGRPVPTNRSWVCGEFLALALASTGNWQHKQKFVALDVFASSVGPSPSLSPELAVKYAGTVR